VDFSPLGRPFFEVLGAWEARKLLAVYALAVAILGGVVEWLTAWLLENQRGESAPPGSNPALSVPHGVPLLTHRLDQHSGRQSNGENQDSQLYPFDTGKLAMLASLTDRNNPIQCIDTTQKNINSSLFRPLALKSHLTDINSSIDSKIFLVRTRFH